MTFFIEEYIASSEVPKNSPKKMFFSKCEKLDLINCLLAVE